MAGTLHPMTGTARGTLQDTTLYTSSYDASGNGRIVCTVSKRIAPSSAQDLDLSQPLFVIYARRLGISPNLDTIDSHANGGIAVRGATGNRLVPSSGIGNNTSPSTTEAPPMTTAVPGNTVAPQRSPDAYGLQVVSPSGCTRVDCDLFIGIAINTGDDGFLDIYMEGSAAGWIAVGFSETADMFSADVVACNRLGDDIVVIDGWNPPPNDRNSQRDTVQDTTLYTSSYDASGNGRIVCTVSKRIAPSSAQDLDLSQPLFVIYARRLGISPNLDTIDSHANGGIAVRGATGNRLVPSSGIGNNTSPSTTEAPPMTTAVPGNTMAPQRSPDAYGLQVVSPSGCTRVDCDLFIGIAINTGDDGFLDIYMEGSAAGWIAVGFSETADMFSADVVACNRLGDDIVVIDGWNPPSNDRNSQRDTVQDTTLYTSSYDASGNGRIVCTVSKRIAPSSAQDLDLSQPLFVIYARRLGISPNLDTIDSHANGGIAVRGATGNRLVPSSGIGNNTSPSTTEAPPMTTAVPGNTVAPQRSPDAYGLQVVSPSGCTRVDCDLFIGIAINTGDDGFLDIYMEGSAAGWIAVGFSETADMFSADVVACNRLGDDIVVIDGWNPPPNDRNSQRDTVQDTTLYTSSYDASGNGRIVCTVSKRIAPSSAQDLDLSQPLFVIYARRLGISPNLDTIDSHANGGIAVRGATGNRLVPSSGIGNNTSPSTTEAPPMTTAVPGNTMAPQRLPDAYGLQVVSPSGCTRVDCDLFIGIAINTGDDGFLDIYMEGSAAGWIAVGFSETADMFSADVVACNRLGDDIVVIDGWNPPSNDRNSQRDTVQDTTLYTSSYNASAGSNGRIACTVSKRIAPSSAQDLDLSQPLFVIYARRLGISPNLDTIDSHANGGIAVRGATPSRLLATNSTGTADENIFETVHRPKLIRAHGILMIIAWPLLAVTAIFFALFMRPALPNGEWFQVHRALLLCSLFIGAVAFILIFIALANSRGLVDVTSNTSLTHLVLGVIIMTLQIINPIISIFRCHPGNKNRWIFNLLHGSVIGLLAEILALINVAIGVYIFSANLSRFRSTRSPFWVFLSWDIFYILLVVTLFVVFTVIATSRKTKGLAPSAVQALFSVNEGEKKAEIVGINLDSAVGDKPQEKCAPERKTPSQDSPLRWAALIVYLGVTVPILLAVIIMVALPQ
ncbi:uncharacterized protein LOC135335239 isoform X1 [Halichondria panicea]|uniref:uncharacterized protein LOC135335239 isoform X1 n=1 Tax=Halichondria panicea TaxID=6063 RepID=UPI00312B7F1E